MSAFTKIIDGENIRIDNPCLHSKKTVVNCLISNIIESKYEFRAITHC